MGIPVLIADDDQKIRNSLKRVLEMEGFFVEEASNGIEAIEKINATPFSCIILDLKMPLLDGERLFEEMRSMNISIPVIILTGHGDIPQAVSFIKKGAFDFIEKPPSMEKIKEAVSKATSLYLQSLKLKRQEDYEKFRYTLIGNSQKMQEVKREIEKVSKTNVPVMITGESGTGKELVGRTIHNLSSFKDGPFIEVNCAAIPDELIESELFGHERGAFTDARDKLLGKFVLANGGSILLDEIGDMSMRSQAKVLRVIETGEVEPLGSQKKIKVKLRVLAATNRDLKALISQGKFREDLYYRLCVYPINVPPLREHREDIEDLVKHFSLFFSWENGTPVKTFSKDVIEILKKQEFKGNIRELKNLVERLIILCPEKEVKIEHLPEEFIRFEPENLDEKIVKIKNLEEFLNEMEREFLLYYLKLYNWNVSKTAEFLKISRSNLYRALNRLNIKGVRDENS